MKEKLFLFDLDGTLLKVQSKKMMQIVDSALHKTDLSNLITKEKNFSGRTDHDIFQSYLTPENQFHYETLKEAYVNELCATLQSEDVQLLSGANEVSDWLSRNNLIWGLLTGNYKKTGLKKLKCSGFPLEVTFGAYGDFIANRSELAAKAGYEASLFWKKSFMKESIIVIGDTPKDVQCASDNGFCSVAVATGNYSVQELESCNPNYVIKSLSELPKLFS